MSEPVSEQAAGLREKLDSAVIAPRRIRSYRAAAFQAYVLLATAVFVGLAVGAHFVPYFKIDLTITRAIQGNHGMALDALMRGLTWAGFMPQVDLLVGLILLVLYVIGLRWEAVVGLFAALGTLVGALIKLLVYRPRPTADLVRVFGPLDTYSFPSGHVLLATAFYGFLAFLAYTLLKPSWYRTLILTVLALIIVLMGLSRIYLGQHWFSDVMGAYMLGSLWLALSIRVYRWGKPRFFRDQPVAPEPQTSSSS
jgi:membrane-associated phospholipid phosphatase